MSVIPLDLQRRFEKRWASRFTGAPNDFVTSAPNNFGSKAAPLTGRRTGSKEKPAGLRQRALRAFAGLSEVRDC
jgi:hypothetical protein